MPTLWTQSLSLRWRPELRFYEKRVEILRTLEEEGFLRAFRVHESAIDARLFDSRDALSVRQDGLVLHLRRSDSDLDRALRAVEISLSTLSPSQPRQRSASFQFLTPVDMEFEAAVRQAYGGALGSLRTGSIDVSDWAFLVDLTDDGTTGQIEFGIVRAEEVPLRLSLTVGRIDREFDRESQPPPYAGGPEEFAPVSLFADLWLAREGGGDAVTLREEVPGFWQTARDEAGNLVSTLETALFGDDRREEVAR
jgi:hypothetical protein